MYPLLLFKVDRITEFLLAAYGAANFLLFTKYFALLLFGPENH